MDEDEILGIVTIVAVISCGILNIFCAYYRPIDNNDDEYIAFQNIV